MSISAEAPTGQTTEQSATSAQATTQAAPATAQPATTTEQAAQPEQTATAQTQQSASDPLWFRERMKQAERSTYRSLGVKDADEAKALIAKGKAADDASKVKQQQDDDLAKKVERSNADLAKYRDIAQKHAERSLSSLTPQQQAYVTKRAGDDPAKILDEIEDLRMLLSFQAPPAPAQASAIAVQSTEATQTTQPTQPRAPLAAPATTSSAAAAPKQMVQQPTDHYTTWQRLRDSNPMQANAYYETHERAIGAQIEARRKQKP